MCHDQLPRPRFIGGSRFKNAKNQWVDVDVTLAANLDGSVAPKGHGAGLKLAGAGGKAGVTQVLASQSSPKGVVSMGWTGALPAPTLKGDTATYANVGTDTDLTVQALRQGFEQSVVLKSAPAAGYTVTLPVTANGLKARQLADASVQLIDASGKVASVIGAPSMWDTQVNAKSLEHAHTGKVTMSVTQSGDTVYLKLTPDAAFLSGSATAYPVTIDPIVSLSTVLDTFVQNTIATSQYASTDLKLGTWNAGGEVARSFLQFPVDALVNSKVLSSSLKLFEYWSSNCTQNSWQLWTTGVADTTTRWTTQPTWETWYATSAMTAGYPASCGGAVAPGWVSVDTTTQLQYGADHGYTYQSMGIKAASETDSNSWKRFYSANAATNVPYLSVTYNTYPTPVMPLIECPQGCSSKVPTL